ncbi:MAG: glutamine synthetase family protein [Pseudomonadota bacterium]
MRHESLIMAVTSDMAGQARGKAFRARDFDKRSAQGVGWCPAQAAMTAFDTIVDNPFGPLGDVLLKPDPSTRVAVDFSPTDPGEHFVLCDLTYLDGRPWECCLRSFLRNAIAMLESETGLTLKVGLEHEFHLTAKDALPARGYHLRSFRAAAGYVEELVAALDLAGVQVDLIHPEYGADQYEVSTMPAAPLAAADHAVILRELTYAIAANRGERVTFSPVVPGMEVGNGVHAHFSLWQGNQPATGDPAGPAGLSEVAGRFVAGMLRHMSALVAITAPSAISYRRLVPHRWSASYNNLALHDREAGMRIGAIDEAGDGAGKLHVEYRPADAAASPYLLLGSLIMAGLQGIRDQLPHPEPTEGDLTTMNESALEAMGVSRLPTTLEEALDALEADQVARSWFPPLLIDVYLRHKRGELASLEGMSEEEMSASYAKAY